MPPADTFRNLHNSLLYFKLPKSLLERKLRLFLLASSSDSSLSAAHAHAMMPNTVLGSTDTLDHELKYILQ